MFFCSCLWWCVAFEVAELETVVETDESAEVVVGAGTARATARRGSTVKMVVSCILADVSSM